MKILTIKDFNEFGELKIRIIKKNQERIEQEVKKELKRRNPKLKLV